jgi:hypothetical protein
MNVDGTDLREVAGLPEGLTSLGSPEWSADGRQIAFDIFRNNVNDAHIYVVNADGTGLQDLARDACRVSRRAENSLCFPNRAGKS